MRNIYIYIYITIVFVSVLQMDEAVLIKSLCGPWYIYPGLTPDDETGKKDIDLFKILSLAAKKAIRRSWLRTNPPYICFY